MRCGEKCSSRKSITRATYAAANISLTGLVLSRRQTEMCTDVADRRNLVGSSIVVLNANAVTGPTPGIVMNLRHNSSLAVVRNSSR